MNKKLGSRGVGIKCFRVKALRSSSLGQEIGKRGLGLAFRGLGSDLEIRDYDKIVGVKGLKSRGLSLKVELARVSIRGLALEFSD